MKIAILASGGNSPGMNDAIITLVKKAKLSNIESVLIYDGYSGLLKSDFRKLDPHYLDQFVSRGNVVIGSSRSKEFSTPAGQRKAAAILKKNKIDVLVVIGGDGSFIGASRLTKLGLKVMGLPGTIDNDVSSTDTTIGFYTCLNTITTSIDAIRDSFESHAGICFVEVMGRGFSDLAIMAGVATGAEAIVTSNNILKVNDFINIANETKNRGKRSCIFVITESIYGKKGLPSLQTMAKQVEDKTHRSTRVNIIGHIQRGGVPVASDRYLASVMANHCIDCIKAKNFNRVICEHDRDIIDIDIIEATTLPRKPNKMDLVQEYNKINRV
jgi:6-phosphofructokinase 1